MTIEFLASGNTARDGSPLVGNKISWDFGDGTTGESPPSKHHVVTHAYQDPGCYLVTSTVTDGNGRTRQWTQDVYVRTTPGNCPA
jgi:PKD repeat protein